MAYKKREELLKEIEILEDYIQFLEMENQNLKDKVAALEENSVQKIKNERNAGRKRRFLPEEEHTIKMMKLQGKSYRAIAKEMGCSVGLAHKLLNEPIGDSNK